MITITEKAVKQLKKFQAQDESKKFRIKAAPTGCCSCASLPTLEIGMDDLQPDDLEEKVSGFSFIINQSLAEKMGDIRVDFQSNITGKRFVVNSSSLDACTYHSFNRS